MEFFVPQRVKDLMGGKIPDRIRLAMAGLALPLLPEEIVPVLSFLALNDPVEEVRKKARESFTGVGEELLRSSLSRPHLPFVFDGVIQFTTLSPPLREVLYQNDAFPDPLFIKLLKEESELPLLEMVAKNHRRLLKSPEIVSVLLEHPSLGPGLKSMVEEFFCRAFAGKVLLRTGAKTKEEVKEEIQESASLPPEEAERLLEEEVDTTLPKDLPPELLEEREMVEEELQELLELYGSEDEGKKEERKGNILRYLSKLSVAEKIKLALMGGKEARMTLVFDGNKVISSMVLQNPRITDQEVKMIASSRAVREELLRSIARNKKFMKSYSVKLALVENPKTPSGISLTLLSQLRDSDLKRIAKSRSVPAGIAQQAKRLLDQKEKK